MSENKNCRVQDDLFHYVNGAWLATAVIPDDRPTTGGFADLDIGVEKTLMADFKAMAEGHKAIPNPLFGDAVALYQKGLDLARRNQEGLKPVLPYLESILSLDDLSGLNESLYGFAMNSMPLPFRFGVEPDMKDTSVFCFYVLGPSTILPDTTYYAEGNQQGQALLGVFSAMAQALLSKTPLSKEEQEATLKDALAFDKIIATLVKSQVEWADYIDCYHPQPLAGVVQQFSPLNFEGLLRKIYGKTPAKIIVYDPRFLKGFATLFNDKTFPLYRHWAYLNLLISASGYLSEELRQIGGTYRRTLLGLAADPAIEKQAYRTASEAYDEVIGLYYGETYFGEAAKKDVVEMVKEIISTYKKRMEKNAFLSEKTKEKAILKLDKIVIKMGYPDQISKLYGSLHFPKDASFFEATFALDSQNRNFRVMRLFEPVDRKEWVMSGHTVNACYNPTSNDITFPAAILQAPFYSLKQSRSANLGGIGAVIGHEISHAFDNNGAKCDENGNLVDWWTEEDFASFKRLTQAMIQQFDGIPFAGSKVNGTLVVSENVADNGGMAVTLEIMSHMKGANYQDYFLNWGKIWCVKAREQYVQLLLAVDVHSPAELRANMQPRNFAEFYRTFNVKKGDGMYLEPAKRIVIW